MKAQMLFILLSKWKTLEARTKKKIYIFLGLFSVFTMAVGVFAVILLVKAGSFLFDKTMEIGQTAMVHAPAVVGQQVNQAVAVAPEVAALGQVNILNCSARLQSLLSLDPWVNVPLSHTFNSVIASCLAPAAPVTEKACEGPEC